MMKARGIADGRFGAWGAALLLIGSLAGCAGGDEEGGDDPAACEDGQAYIDGECRDLPETVTCGQGTELVDGRCEPASALVSCGDGTVDSDGSCRPSNDACGEGTVLVDGACELAFTPLECGDGTGEAGGYCVPSGAACGEGTELDAGVCRLAFVPLVCGEDTMEHGDECVTAVACGPGTVRVEKANGSVTCLDPVDATLNAKTFSERLARAYCESFERCCERRNIWSDYVGREELDIDYQTCVERFALMAGEELGIIEARVIERDYPAGTVEFDAQLFDIMMRQFSANDDCEVVFDEEMLFDGPHASFFKANRPVGSPCYTSGACAEGAYCHYGPEEEVGSCRLLGSIGDECRRTRDCRPDLFCDDAVWPHVCAPGGEVDDSCNWSRPCREGLSCYAGPDGFEDQVCAPSGGPPPDYACMDERGCPDGHYCQQEGPVPQCMPFIGLGEECDSDTECLPAALCGKNEPDGTRVCTDRPLFCELMRMD